jgi:hypothetical protein
MERHLMGFRAKNDRKRLAALAPAKARGGCEAVLTPHPTAGAANAGQIVPLVPRKPDGLLRSNRKNLTFEFSCVKTPTINESSP